MSLVKIRALEMLKDDIECAIPKLAGKVCAGHAKHPKQQPYPHCSIIVTRGQYFPDQADLYSSPSPSIGVFRLGRIEATAQIRLGCANPDERYQLGELLLSRVFMHDLERPGIRLVSIPDCDDALVAFELDEWAWEDEMAFDNQWYSMLTCRVQFPVLVRKGTIYSIEEIQQQFTEDLDSDVVAAVDVETTVIDATT